jgi:hypothetical protein
VLGEDLSRYTQRNFWDAIEKICATQTSVSLKKASRYLTLKGRAAAHGCVQATCHGGTGRVGGIGVARNRNSVTEYRLNGGKAAHRILPASKMQGGGPVPTSSGHQLWKAATPLARDVQGAWTGASA